MPKTQRRSRKAYLEVQNIDFTFSEKTVIATRAKTHPITTTTRTPLCPRNIFYKRRKKREGGLPCLIFLLTSTLPSAGILAAYESARKSFIKLLYRTAAPCIHARMHGTSDHNNTTAIKTEDRSWSMTRSNEATIQQNVIVLDYGHALSILTFPCLLYIP